MNRTKPTAKGSAAAKLAWETRRRVAAEDIPPHAIEAEEGALSSVIQAGDSGSQQNVDAMLHQLQMSHFYDHRTLTLFRSLCDMRFENKAIDLPMLMLWLKANKVDGELISRLDGCGGKDYLLKLVKDASPGPLNFSYYLPSLEEYRWRRYALASSSKFAELAKDGGASLDKLQLLTADLHEKAAKIGANKQPLIRLVTPEEARQFVPSPEDYLVGDGLITRGMFVVIAGVPSVGKSRLATTLAVAGARGTARWMNIPIRSKWRTLILQKENTSLRLKKEFSAVPREYDDFIRVSDGLSYGLAFGEPEFRREVRRIYEQWPFEMLVIDPWNKVIARDSQEDYMAALANIEQCFHGLKMPAVVIVAHLRKKSRDEKGSAIKRGRDLLDEISGSLGLGSTARSVFTVQPVTSDQSDHRIIFDIAKNNDDETMDHTQNRSAWKRANGAFEHIPHFDWTEVDSPGAPQRRSLDEEMIVEVFAGEKGSLKAAAIAKRLSDVHEIGTSTTHRAIGPGGYLRHLFDVDAKGALTLKKDLLPILNGTNGHKVNGHARH